MIRFILLNAFIGLHTIVFCLLSFPLALFDRDGSLIHFWIAVPWAKAILWVSGIRVRVSGLENLAEDRPRILMTNHQSTYDIFALLAHIPLHFKFILKQELMRLPFLGSAMRRAGYIGIEREDPRKAVKSMRDAAEKIRHGASVVIFPEGTRSPDGTLQSFKRGGFNLALKAGCDIVPIGIRDSYKIVPKGSFRIRKGAFDLSIGKPIPTKDYNKKNIQDLMERVRSAIVELMARPRGDGEQ